MTLLFTLLTLAVLGVIAAVATGRIAGGLEEPSTSLPARGLPAGELTPGGLEVVRFSPALRGYRMDEVDAVLDRLGTELARRDQEIAELRDELRLVERSVRGNHPHRAYSEQEFGGTAGHAGTEYPGQDYPGLGYAEQGYSGRIHPDQGYSAQTPPEQTYPPHSYAHERPEYGLGEGRATEPRSADRYDR